MKKLSVWAKNHKQSARIAIVISFLLIITTGIITGTLLNELGIIIPASALIVILCIYFISILAYPSLRQKTKIAADRFYQWQKTCDFTLALSGFLIIVYVSNGDFRALRNIPVQNATAASSTSLPGDSSSQKTYKSISAFSASLKNEEGKKLRLKERKKLLKEQVKAIKNSTDMSKGGKIALIILSVIVALGLLSLVASLACGLSCNGSAAGAILVAIGGTALVVYLLIITIRAINGKKRKKALEEEEPPKTNQ